MKKILSFLLLCACGQGISAQVDRLSLDFQNCANDTEFVIQKSLHGFSTAVFETKGKKPFKGPIEKIRGFKSLYISINFAAWA
jgi:hypothetical protein